jgi:hypothetical protein
MKNMAMTELFTKITLYATLYRIYYEGIYFLFQRYGLAPKMNLSAGDLALLLNDYFPGLVFISPNSIDVGIANYVIQENGKWILDIYAMSKTKEKIFLSLFPENISGWDEAKARTRYGCADLIRFFIDMENDAFSAGFFNDSAGSDKAVPPGESIPARFFKELDYNGKPVWEDWNFSTLVIHKLRRRPPLLYEAFGYYARRFYTLMKFGLGSGNITDDELIKSGTKLLNAIIREQMPETANFGIERLTVFFEIIQETLESVPLGGSLYTPAETDVFIKQLIMKTIDLYKNHRLWKERDTADSPSAYNEADRKTINKHVGKAEKIVTDTATLSELRRVKLTGTYSEKINLVHRIVSVRPPRENYSQRELDIIYGLFLKQHRPLSLYRLSGGYDEENPFNSQNLIIDDKYVSAEDHLLWSSFFRDEFEKELDKDGLEKFIAILPDHFSKYPFDIDSDGKLGISKYSRKMLFSTFCSVAGIPPDDELWKPFLVLMHKVVNSINNERIS